MDQGVVATADRLIAYADSHVAAYEQRAGTALSKSRANYCQHEADAWRHYADRLRTIAMRHGLTRPSKDSGDIPYIT